jgi:hypothetical protein
LLVVGACLRRTGPQRFVGNDEFIDRTLTRFLRDYGVTALSSGELIVRLGELASTNSLER